MYRVKNVSSRDEESCHIQPSIDLCALNPGAFFVSSSTAAGPATWAAKAQNDWPSSPGLHTSRNALIKSALCNPHTGHVALLESLLGWTQHCTTSDTYGKRACGLMISSGKNKLRLASPRASMGGSVNAPVVTPRRGKEVRVTGSSCGKR